MKKLNLENQYQRLQKMMPDIPEIKTRRDLFARLESLRDSLPRFPENHLSAYDIIKELTIPSIPN